MSRLIFIIVIIAVVYFLLKSYSRKAHRQDEAPPRTQDMVSCAFCGVHLPKSESLLVNGKYYCCAAHSQGRAE